MPADIFRTSRSRTFGTVEEKSAADAFLTVKEKRLPWGTGAFSVFVDSYLYLFICHKSSSCGPFPEQFVAQYENTLVPESHFLGIYSQNDYYHIVLWKWINALCCNLQR
jgi:hypothetical protein